MDFGSGLLKTEYLGKLIRNTWHVMRCGVGEGGRRSVD
jgi:hypothetical protein